MATHQKGTEEEKVVFIEIVRSFQQIHHKRGSVCWEGRRRTFYYYHYYYYEYLVSSTESFQQSPARQEYCYEREIAGCIILL